MVVYSVFPFIFRSQYYVVTVTLNFYARVLQNLKYIMSFIRAEMVGGGLCLGQSLWPGVMFARGQMSSYPFKYFANI